MGGRQELRDSRSRWHHIPYVANWTEYYSLIKIEDQPHSMPSANKVWAFSIYGK
jgi:hypothetical protein